MEQFSNHAFLKWSNSQIKHFSKSANWGRHHQLDDSLVGQITSQHPVSTLGVNTYLKEGAGWVTLNIVPCKLP